MGAYDKITKVIATILVAILLEIHRIITLWITGDRCAEGISQQNTRQDKPDINSNFPEILIVGKIDFQLFLPSKGSKKAFDAHYSSHR